MGYKFKDRTCERCNTDYTPTGSFQRFCPPCGVLNRRERSYNWYHFKGGRAYDREYKRTKREAWNMVNDLVTEKDFVDGIHRLIDRRRGSMLSVNSTTKRVLRDLGVYEEIWRQKRNRGGIATRFHSIVADVFEEREGVYFNSSVTAGDQYQFPLKERKR